MEFTRLKKLLDHFITLGIPGVDCAVYHHGKPVFRYMTGYADREAGKPVDENTVWSGFSVTKLLTCTAALKLYEEGKFLLDDPLYWYLPEFENMTVWQPDGSVAPARNRIEVGQLFSMSAGFGFGASRETIEKVLKETDGRAPTREVIRASAQDPLQYEPGEGWIYGYCHDVLGVLVEVISGMKLSEYCRKEILEPLGLKNMFFHVPEEQEKDLAPLYMYVKEACRSDRLEGNPLPVAPGPEYECGQAGLLLTVTDYVQFADALCRGKILSPHTLDLMRTNVLTEKQLALFRASREPGVRVASERRGYGYGLGVRTMMDRVEGGSNGPVGEFGWGGAAGAYVLLDPENELTLFYEQQTMAPNAEYTRSRLRNVLYACVK